MIPSTVTDSIFERCNKSNEREKHGRPLQCKFVFLDALCQMNLLLSIPRHDNHQQFSCFPFFKLKITSESYLFIYFYPSRPPQKALLLLLLLLSENYSCLLIIKRLTILRTVHFSKFCTCRLSLDCKQYNKIYTAAMTY